MGTTRTGILAAREAEEDGEEAKEVEEVREEEEEVGEEAEEDGEDALPADSFDYEQSFEAGEDKREDGEGDGEEAEEEEEVDGEVDGEEAEEEDDGEEAEVRVVNKLSQKYFRDRLVEHFNIMFRRGELRWPKRRGTTPPSILTR